jgi:hypothetical protein
LNQEINMNRRHFFRLLSGVPVVATILAGQKPEASTEKNPLHECVDRPDLPCPACAKWTGDPLAVKSNPPQGGWGFLGKAV